MVEAEQNVLLVVRAIDYRHAQDRSVLQIEWFLAKLPDARRQFLLTQVASVDFMALEVQE